MSLSALGAENDPRPREYALDIRRMSLPLAVREFMEQTSLQVAYFPSDDDEWNALVGPLAGRYSADEALTRLLEPTRFTFRRINEDTLVVLPRAAQSTGRDRSLARTDEGPSPESGSLDSQSHAVARRGGAGRSKGSGDPEGITVLGVRLREFVAHSAPVVVMERERIDELGVPTLAELLRYVSQQAYTRPEGYRTSGAQYAELRGLGADTTLVLIDGRRTFSSGNSLVSSAFDLNSVPITAVERVEILLDSASAPYGSDAIGGVINIVLRQNVIDPVLELNYAAADGGAEQRRASISAGGKGERFGGGVVLDYFDLDGLLGAERDRWRDQDFRRFGSVDQRSLVSHPGNISSLTGAPLPGLPTSFAALPVGSAGGTVTREDFLATAGQRNSESLFGYWSVVPFGRRVSAAAAGTMDLTADLQASAELLYADRSARYQFGPPMLAAVVPASNAFNPFGTVVIAQRLLAAMEPQRQFVESTWVRGATALRGRRGRWNWELSVLQSQEEVSTWIDGALDPARLAAALAQSTPDLALNVFQDGPGGSAEVLAGLLADRHVDELSSNGTQIAGFVSGPILDLPAGPLTAIMGGEGRREAAQFDGALGAFDRDIAGGFAQLRLPLVAPPMRWPAVQELTLTLAGRVDHYSDMGETAHPQYGLLWTPHRGLRIRASYGSSFRPASLYELYSPKIPTLAQVSDPKRGEPAGVTLLTGGNADLVPTTGESFTAGFAIAAESERVRELSFTVDYWRVRMDDRVAVLPAALFLANEERFGDRIARDAPTQADQAAGLPGRLRQIDTSRLNGGHLHTSGIDVSATCRIDTAWGRFTPRIEATWTAQFETVDVLSLPAVDRVNVASELGTIPRWRAVASLGWRRRPAAATLTARHTPEYADATGGVPTGRALRAQTVLDLQASLDVGAAGVKLTAGASNVLDQEPRFAEVGSAAGFDLSQADLKQRLFYLRLAKTW